MRRCDIRVECCWDIKGKSGTQIRQLLFQITNKEIPFYTLVFKKRELIFFKIFGEFRTFLSAKEIWQHQRQAQESPYFERGRERSYCKKNRDLPPLLQTHSGRHQGSINTRRRKEKGIEKRRHEGTKKHTHKLLPPSSGASFAFLVETCSRGSVLIRDSPNLNIILCILAFCLATLNSMLFLKNQSVFFESHTTNRACCCGCTYAKAKCVLYEFVAPFFFYFFRSSFPAAGVTKSSFLPSKIFL